MRVPLLIGATLVLAACSPAENPELACQQRIVAVQDQSGPATVPETEAFQHSAYAAVDRTGCTAAQLAKLNQITRLAKELPALTAANNKLGESKDPGHPAAFQAMNNAVIALNDLQQGAKADLEQMTADAAR
jgi:hypothetical protein